MNRSAQGTKNKESAKIETQQDANELKPECKLYVRVCVCASAKEIKHETREYKKIFK